MRYNLYLLFIFSLLLILSCKNDHNLEKKAPDISLMEVLNNLEYKSKDLHILIDKSDYELSVLHNDQIIKTYPVVLGTNPVDDKLMEGDRRTPEGHFKVRDFYPHKNWSKFIWIDYPTEESYKNHENAKQNGSIPADATIGGEIGIHGTPPNKESLIENKINWTWGCISMTNSDVNDLYKIIYIDMEIVIQD
ncbi:L,D-transpeptidase-like protein [Nonlabens dokdonensis]|nr:L,D-transpeptidase-like protein [Nonlabens dokdonensis]